MMRLFLFLFLLMLVTPATTNAQSDDTTNSPWPRSHRTAGQQAATPFRGPESPEPQVQVSSFRQDAGKEMGTSPFLVLSGRKYPQQPRARTLWGATLTDVYKYEIDGETFRFVDRFEINKLPVWLGWNLFRLSGDRIVVPDPNGLRLRQYRGTPCYGTKPALLVFQDGETPGSPIQCVRKFEFTRQRLRSACGFDRTAIGTMAVINGELPTGEVAVSITREQGRGFRKRQSGFMAILDPDLSRIEACAKVDESGPTNQYSFAALPGGDTMAFVATEENIVAMRYSPSDRSLRQAGATRTNFRKRTGTTPTLMSTSDGRQLILTVDGQCAVAKVFTGEIRCSDQAAPSQLVAVECPSPLKLGHY